MIQELNKNKIIEILSGELPGNDAHSRMEPELKHDFLNEKNCREAAVLILLYPVNASLKIVFIKRNEYDGPHSGQISFPGGMKEDSDPDFTYTALRETEEETGVPSQKIEILGKLSKFFIPVSNFCVHPFVGWMDDAPEFKPDHSEVQYLICPSLAELSDPRNRKKGTFSRRGTIISTPYIDIEGEMIWGATAMMLNEFIELIG